MARLFSSRHVARHPTSDPSPRAMVTSLNRHHPSGQRSSSSPSCWVDPSMSAVFSGLLSFSLRLFCSHSLLCVVVSVVRAHIVSPTAPSWSFPPPSPCDKSPLSSDDSQAQNTVHRTHRYRVFLVKPSRPLYRVGYPSFGWRVGRYFVQPFSPSHIPSPGRRHCHAKVPPVRLEHSALCSRIPWTRRIPSALPLLAPACW